MTTPTVAATIARNMTDPNSDDSWESLKTSVTPRTNHTATIRMLQRGLKLPVGTVSTRIESVTDDTSLTSGEKPPEQINCATSINTIRSSERCQNKNPAMVSKII